MLDHLDHGDTLSGPDGPRVGIVAGLQMQLEHYLPQYDVSEWHRIFVPVSAARSYEALKRADFSRSLLVRVLFRLRGIPIEGLPTFIERMFIVLYDEPGREIVWGMVSRPWLWRYESGRLELDAAGFERFAQAGYAKIVWNFAFEERNEGTVISTETRVRCEDAASRRKFRAYWFVVGPFSALIRKEMLRIVKAAALA